MGNKVTTQNTSISTAISEHHEEDPNIKVGPSVAKLWTNLKGNPFQENIEKWYNLSTNRYVKNPPKDPKICWSLREVRILGTADQIDSFCTRNNLKSEKFQPFNDVAFVCEDAVKKSSLGKPVHTSTETLNDLSAEQLKQIKPFNYDGLFLECRVTNIHDGDTLTGVIHVNLEDLSRNGSCLPCSTGSFFTSVKIRTYGYDAQELDTAEGKTARDLLTKKIESFKNVIWVHFLGQTDKYGRSLGVLYEDKEKKHCLNTYLLGCGGNLVRPYLGGTKQTF